MAQSSHEKWTKLFKDSNCKISIVASGLTQQHFSKCYLFGIGEVLEWNLVSVFVTFRLLCRLKLRCRNLNFSSKSVPLPQVTVHGWRKFYMDKFEGEKVAVRWFYSWRISHQRISFSFRIWKRRVDEPSMWSDGIISSKHHCFIHSPPTLSIVLRMKI